MTEMLIDTHCHLEKAQLRGELEAQLLRAKEAGVKQLITVGTGPQDWPVYQQMARHYPGCVFWTAGLHPCDVTADWETALARLPAYWAQEPRPVALGEIGLDHFHLPKDLSEREATRQRQHDAFREQLRLARDLEGPLVIHSRNAASEVIQEIDASGVDWSRVVFHCFADGPEEMRAITERGGRASFTGIITFKSAENVRQALLGQGLERLMVETDAPYLAPVPHRGQPCEPAYVCHTAQKAAELLGVPLPEFARQTTANAQDFFALA